MLCVEDALDGLKWAQSIGGVSKLIERSENNLKAITSWVEQTEWVEFLPADPTTCSNTSICLKIVDPWYQSLSAEEQAAGAKKLVSLLDAEGVAYDIGAYRAAPPGLRIWGGGTIETSDIEVLLPWLEWAFGELKHTAQAAA
jgi:phosphoserine aminotransferase